MRIAVLLKQVPDTDEVRIDETKGVLVREGLGTIINPLDLHALEAALLLKRSRGVSVTALTMGPSQADVALREALALGADDAILLCDPSFAGSDTWATARALSTALSASGPYDLILAGEKATDGETGQVGPETAVMCKLPFSTYVSFFSVSDDSVTVRRTVEDGIETQQLPLPCLLTVLRDINEPSMPALSGKMRARRAHIREMDAGSLGLDPSTVGLSGSPTRVVRIFYPKVTRKTELFSGKEIDSGVGRFVEALRERSLIGR
ncbi:MAG: electron transfer flavoprotein subunit beta/FixA family protein [Thermovirgaceae bacterium]|nr:electron transfer flavoprotein subunit beta/FixA family protein [Thermovirgaceae bacterium]